GAAADPRRGARAQLRGHAGRDRRADAPVHRGRRPALLDAALPLRGRRGPAAADGRGRAGDRVSGASPRFGTLLTFPETSRHGVAEVARHAERLGFDLVCAWDHIHADGNEQEVWTTLTWAAASTTRVRVAPNVLAPFYRHPLVVAKMAETLD